ncbi:15684_t:CDS:2, partial [Racocetra persica]
MLPKSDEPGESAELLDESDEIKQIKNMIEQINIFKQIFRFAIIYGAFFDIFLRNIPQIVIQIKWVPMDGNNLQEIEEELDLFMATWKNGIRTIEYVSGSGSYTRSRNESCVDLIKLCNSQINTSDVIKKLNEMINEEYKIYGITKDEIDQYIIVLDYYCKKRNINYGKC